MKMKKYYFTFGYGQGHDSCYVIIEAGSYLEAREEMTRTWGIKWGFQYESAEAAGVERFNLRLIK